MGKNIQNQEKNEQEYNVTPKNKHNDSRKTNSNLVPRKDSVNNGKAKGKKPTKK